MFKVSFILVGVASYSIFYLLRILIIFGIMNIDHKISQLLCAEPVCVFSCYLDIWHHNHIHDMDLIVMLLKNDQCLTNYCMTHYFQRLSWVVVTLIACSAHTPLRSDEKTYVCFESKPLIHKN